MTEDANIIAIDSAPTEQKTPPECGRFLNCIYFYLTEGCNLRCRHCWIAPKYQTEKAQWPSVPYDLFVDIVEQGKELGLSSVKLTGGEPLIHPEIDRILDYLAGQDLQLTIETNGVPCTPERVAKIKKCKNPFVSISLDGSDAKTHEWVRGVEGCFDAAVQGVRNLAAVGLNPQVIMSIMNHNADQMESVVRLAEEIGASSVKFNLVTPTARGEQMHEAGETLSIERLIELGHWVETELSKSTKLRVVYSHPFAFKPMSAMYGAKNGLGKCGIFGIIGVLGGGKYALCGIGESVPELIFGHAEKDRLAHIWNNTPILNEIREGLPRDLEGICGDCLMRAICLGHCIALNYYRSHRLFAPQWYCDEARAAGLFPESRLRPPKKTKTEPKA